MGATMTRRRFTVDEYYCMGEAGILETWLMNLPADRIEVYRDPAPEGYRSITLVPRDGAVSPLAFPDVSIPCAELLP
jgi:Uma2 family endonuclease